MIQDIYTIKEVKNYKGCRFSFVRTDSKQIVNQRFFRPVNSEIWKVGNKIEDTFLINEETRKYEHVYRILN